MAKALLVPLRSSMMLPCQRLVRTREAGGLAHLPYKGKNTYEEYRRLRGLQHMGKKKWRRYVECILGALTTAGNADDVILGDGNAKKMQRTNQGELERFQ
jgi:hypothetical protein